MNKNTIYRTTKSGITRVETCEDEEKARKWLADHADRIRETSTGEKYSFYVSAQTEDRLAVGVVEGNPEAVVFTIE